MSVLMEFAIFPTDKGSSVSDYVSKVLEMIRESPFPYKLTAMGTIIETQTTLEALQFVEKAEQILSKDSNRIYASIKLDIQKGKNNRLERKIESIEEKIGKVNK